MTQFVLLGEQLGHSWSPIIHTRILEAMQANGEYTLLESARGALPKTLIEMREAGVRGANVTIPYKQEIMPLLDDIAPEAARIGAINTISFAEKTIGYNTDYFGFLSMLEEAGMTPSGKRALVLGAGGAAMAVVAALLDTGAATVTVAARDATKLAMMQEHFPETGALLLSKQERLAGDLLVNTTPVGMYPAVDAAPVSREIIARFSAVADLIYNPTPTLLAKTAQELGIPSCCGLYMLIYQAIKAQEIWQNRKVPAKTAQKIYMELSKQIY